ncbi:16S rRNA m(7)G-527 methyltransferase [Alkalibaculum bacchi]|uniref:Ribosomal RNA small subunit methyltransferase G n=1 Tax=Alkalibaculum bacchi TaxID=645887 RepID=A0A366I4A9_9FIRM|nr:16S rRNA (guanine(527)-N(7))-methyltransferase RsmG [Alkalibaculum bacchi]RBP62101.1 16S rRNA m(7)G-527 methyltransferase [Alkalibaculum bacchi]
MGEKNVLISTLNQLNIQIKDEQADALLSFMDILLEANKHINLTSITEPEDFILKHIVDSLIMLSRDYVKEGIKVLDLGTGGGFPGIPLKILYPEIQITLVDSVGKKLKFIDDAARNLGIKVELVHERAENLGKNKKYREKYDIVISRAVANMQTLSELCLPLVKVDGLMIASKGPKYNEELDAAKNAMKILGGQVKSIEDCTIPIAELERHVIVIQKTNATPAAYPRKPGMPNKNPL